MTGKEFRTIAQRVYGQRGWQRKVADALAVNKSTVSRWTSGQIPVPGPAAVALQGLERNS